MLLRFVFILQLFSLVFLFADKGNFNPADCLDECAVFRLETEFQNIKNEHKDLQNNNSVQKEKLNNLKSQIESQLTFYKENTTVNKNIHSESLTLIQWIIGIIGALIVLVNLKWIDSKIESVVLKKATTVIDTLTEKSENLDKSLKELTEKSEDLDKSLEEMNLLKPAVEDLMNKYEVILSEYSSKVEGLKKSAETYTFEDKQTLEKLVKDLNLKKDKSASDLYYIGTDLLNKGQHKDALDYLEQAKKIDPKELATYINIGITLSEMERYDDAIEIYKEAFKISPTFHLANANIAVPFINKGMYDEAIEYSKKAIELSPRIFGAYLNLFEAEVCSGYDFDEKYLMQFKEYFSGNTSVMNVLYVLDTIGHIKNDKTLSADLVNWQKNLTKSFVDSWSILGVELYATKYSKLSDETNLKLIAQIEIFKEFI